MKNPDTPTAWLRGFSFVLSGVSGYEIVPGVEVKPAVLEKYQKLIEKVNHWVQGDALENYLDRNSMTDGSEGSQFKTVEAKLLEYIKNTKSVEAVELLIAYQLKGEYENLIRGTRDRVVDDSNTLEKEYIMLSSLAEHFGDRMKETILSIENTIKQSPDKQYFGRVFDYTQIVKKTSEGIFNDLGRIPQERLTDDIIQKKIAKDLKTRFQNVPVVKEKAEEIAKSFTLQNLDSLEIDLENIINPIVQDSNRQDDVDVSALRNIQMASYQEISEEIAKYREIVETDTLSEKVGEQEKSVKSRSVAGYFSKTKENSLARMVGDVCIGTNVEMWNNPDYFEFVLFDPERKKNTGTVMLLTMNESDGKKYLLYCPNPSVDLVAKVSAEGLYKKIKKQIIEFAKENNFDGVICNPEHGMSTNRGGKFQQSLNESLLKDKSEDFEKVSLEKEYKLGIYKYQKDLNYIWKK